MTTDWSTVEINRKFGSSIVNKVYVPKTNLLNSLEYLIYIYIYIRLIRVHGRTDTIVLARKNCDPYFRGESRLQYVLIVIMII